MQKNRLHNESGVVLVTVIILTIVLSIVVIGIMSLNISQVTTGRSVVDTVVAEQLATGLFYQNYQQKFEGKGTTPGTVVLQTPYGQKTYTIQRTDAPDVNAPNNTNKVQINLTLEPL